VCSLNEASASLFDVMSFQDQIHFEGGVPVVAAMKKYPCPCIRLVWEPCGAGDMKIRKIIVVFKGQHNHPAFPDHKLSLGDLHLVETAFTAVGSGAITAAALNLGKSENICTFII